MNTTDTIGGSEVASFTNTAGWTFTLHRQDDDGWEIRRSGGAQHRGMTAQASGDDIEAGLAVLRVWEAAFNGDPSVLGTPEGHEPIRDYLAGGAMASDHPGTPRLLEALAGRTILDRRGHELATARHVAYMANVNPAALVVPLTDDQRTDTEKAAEVRAAYQVALWTNELLMDDDLAERFEATMSPDQSQEVNDERAMNVEDDELDRRPFSLEVADLGEYRCGLTGEVCHGPAFRVVPSGGWVADELREVADRLVFSPAVVRAALGEVA